MTREAFLVLIGLVALQRAIELVYGRRNTKRMLRRGGREHAPEQMKWMALLHGAWLLAMPLEVWLFDRSFDALLAVCAFTMFLGGQALRYAAIRRLRGRWTTSIVTLPGEPLVRDGVFRYVRHPNYLGVALEIAALPLVHGAWLTAIVFSLLNGWMLKSRIEAEEDALDQDNDYRRTLGDRPRFLPVRPRRGES
jgi:methyltransferase